MFKSLSLIAAATLAFAGAASAADLRGSLPEPVYAPPPPAAAGFDWSGPYAGLNLGYGGGDERYAYDLVLLATSGTDGQRNNGVVGGGQIGYNYAFGNTLFGGGGLVVGAEADFDGSAIAGSAVLDSSLVYARVASRLNYFGTVRGRLGATFDRLMVYATGGFAYGQMTTTVVSPADAIADRASHLHTGYAVGAGFEYAVTGNVLLRAEYLRLDLGTKTSYGGGTWATYDLHERPVENIVRAGIDYKFDLAGAAAGPLFARY